MKNCEVLKIGFLHADLTVSQTDFKAPAEARCFDTAVNYLVSSSR